MGCNTAMMSDTGYAFPDAFWAHLELKLKCTFGEKPCAANFSLFLTKHVNFLLLSGALSTTPPTSRIIKEPELVVKVGRLLMV